MLRKIQVVSSVALVIFLLTSLPVSGSRTAVKYIITKFGAIGDGKTSNTVNIQNAINECFKNGGVVVVVPSGRFITGAIFLKQGVNLLIEKDGILKGSVRQDDYPQINTRWEGIERIWTSALINIIDVHNVEISGEGTIDGSGIDATGVVAFRTFVTHRNNIMKLALIFIILHS